MKLIKLSAILLFVLAACGSEPVSKQPSIAADNRQSCVSVGRNPDHPNSCAKVIDQPFEGTAGEPESIEWFINKRNTKVNRISHFKKYCKTPQPNTSNMDQKQRAKALSKWRNDRWDCAKKKHYEKMKYWVAYLEGQEAAAKASEDWLSDWYNDYRDAIQSVKEPNLRGSLGGTGTFADQTCRSQGYAGGYSDVFGKITCNY